MPANREPIITESAPAARALVMSPENLMPPSAMSGTSVSRQARAHSWMAVICGTPAPVTTRVVQIEPGPMPTLTASTPRAMRSRAPSYVATLPAMSGTSGWRSLMRATAAMTFSLWPWEESRHSTSTLAATRASHRASRSPPAPTAAPTRSRPSESLQAPGYSWAFWMSLTVISPLRVPSSSTTRSFSMRCWWSSALACSRVVPTGAVMRFSLVMKSAIGRSRSRCRTAGRGW